MLRIYRSERKCKDGWGINMSTQTVLTFTLHLRSEWYIPCVRVYDYMIVFFCLENQEKKGLRFALAPLITTLVGTALTAWPFRWGTPKLKVVVATFRRRRPPNTTRSQPQPGGARSDTYIHTNYKHKESCACATVVYTHRHLYGAVVRGTQEAVMSVPPPSHHSITGVCPYGVT